MRRIQTYPDRGAKVCLPRGDTKREGSTINRRGVAVITVGCVNDVFFRQIDLYIPLQTALGKLI